MRLGEAQTVISGGCGGRFHLVSVQVPLDRMSRLWRSTYGSHAIVHWVKDQPKLLSSADDSPPPPLCSGADVEVGHANRLGNLDGISEQTASCCRQSEVPQLR